MSDASWVAMLCLSCPARLCRMDASRKEALTALQAMEQLDIRRASDEFAEQVEDYRKYFRARAPFAVADPQLKLEHVRSACCRVHPLLCCSLWEVAPTRSDTAQICIVRTLDPRSLDC